MNQERRFDIGDLVWFVRSGVQKKEVPCPDCLGALALTVILGDGSQVSIACNCCDRGGYLGSQGTVAVYEWSCDVASGRITRIELAEGSAKYALAYWYPDWVFASKGEAQQEAAKVLAEHQAEEERRFNHVKDHKGRHYTWAWNVAYHRREAKRAARELAYHKGRLTVAKAKNKETS